MQVQQRGVLWTYMLSSSALSRHSPTGSPLVGIVIGLLLVSACSTSFEPATSDTDISGAPSTAPPATSAVAVATDQPTTTSPAPNEPPVSAPSATVSPTNPVPIAAVDVTGQTVFGIGIFESVDVEAVAIDVSGQLGSPTTDTGWQSIQGQFNCAGSTEFRVLWWGDFRMTFERYSGDGAIRDELSAWTVGDPSLFEFVPIGDMPAPTPSRIVTLEGIGLGSTLAEANAVWANLNNGGDGQLVVIDRGGALLIELDDTNQISGFGNGPFDCPVDETR